MKGLLYKDFVSILDAYKKNLILVLLVYTFMAFTMDMPFMLYALIFLMGIYATSSLNFDELSHWDVYARTLPVSVGQLIASKYLLGLACMASGAVLAFLGLAGAELLHGRGPDEVFPHLMGCTASLVITLLYAALSFPLSYKMGNGKARSGVMMAMGFIFLAAYALARFFPELIAAAKSFLATVGDGSVVLVILLLAAGSLALYLVSWAVSAAIYQSKEY